MTETLGNFAVSAPCIRARASGSRGPCSAEIYVCGAPSNVPGLNTNMKPPARKSCQSTRRTLVTRAVMMRPSTSNRISSPTLMREPRRKLPSLSRSEKRSSIDTSACPWSGSSPHHSPSMSSSLASRLRAIRHGVLARQPATPCLLVAVDVHLTPADGHDARAQRRDHLGPGRVTVGLIEKRLEPVALVGLDVDQKHVGRIRTGLDGEVAQQVGLKRPHPEDEKRAETDGQQDDARLIAWPRDVQNRLPQREMTANTAAAGRRARDRPLPGAVRRRLRRTRPTASAQSQPSRPATTPPQPARLQRRP